MKIAFFTHPYPNYVPDLLLHGLRKLLGPAVVDYPRKDCLYQGVLGLGVCQQDQLCPGWFPTDEGVDRGDMAAKLAGGHFDWVVCDLRAVPTLYRTVAEPKAKVVIVDGEDRPADIPPGPYVICRRETDGSDFSIPLPMALPEELLHWIAAYDELPKRYGVGFLGSTHDDTRRRLADAIAARFPDALLAATAVPSGDDPRPEGRLGRDDYYRRLQQCRVVLSLKGAGWDTFRFWENAACNAVHLAQQMPLFVPDDFQDKVHLLRFGDVEQLTRCVEECLGHEDRSQEMVREGRYHLVRHHLTERRAAYFIDRVRRAFQP